jgi:transposase
MAGRYVGIDLHRRRSVIYAMDGEGEKLFCERIDNDALRLLEVVSAAGEGAEVVIEATYGWYWAVDLLREAGFSVHLAHPSGNDWGKRRVKNDERDARDFADLLRLGRLAEAWIAPPAVREARELVRYRARLVQLRSGLKAQVHASPASTHLSDTTPSATSSWSPGRISSTPRRIRVLSRDTADGIRASRFSGSVRRRRLCPPFGIARGMAFLGWVPM